MNSSIVLEITLMITYMYYKDLTNLVTLNTRNVLKILTDLNAEIADPPEPKINSSINERETIILKLIFFCSAKNLPPL